MSPDGGFFPMWGPDGKELFYAQSQGTLMVVPVDTEPTFNRGNASLVFEGPYRGTASPANARAFDISPDGQQFLMIKENRDLFELSQIIIVQNWNEELKRLVPVD